MALRIANKINRQALQNVCKSLYSGSSESTCTPRSTSNDVSSVTTTITSTSSTINTNNTNVPTSSVIVAVAPPTSPATNPPPSASSGQSSVYLNQNKPLIPIGTEELFPQELSGNETVSICATTSSAMQMPSLSKAYQVCPVRPKRTVEQNDRKSQFNPVSYNKNNKVASKGLETHHLQPRKQAKFYDTKKINVDTPLANTEALREAVEQGGHTGMKEPLASETNGGYRKFQESMTYRNLTQPLKLSRLANPFPDPVKEMASDKVTDQEKASQMFTESRSNAMAQAHFAQRQKQLKLKPQTPIQPGSMRHYSSDKSAGKAQCFTRPLRKKTKNFKKKTFNVKLDKTCPPANECTGCKDVQYVYKDCTKKEAPYPCYSEMCHEHKPFVCRSCPWVDDIHPAFKPKKKNYHTASRAMSMTSGISATFDENNDGGCSRDMNSVCDEGNDGSGNGMDLKKRNSRRKPECQPQIGVKKTPCAWVELDKKNEEQQSSVLPRKRKPKTPPVIGKKVEPMDDPSKQAAHVTDIAQPMREWTIDASKKKGPCKPTIVQKRCPPTSTVITSYDKWKRHAPNTRKSPPSPSKKANDITSNISSYIDDTHPPPMKTSYMPEDVVVPAISQSIDDWLAGLRPSKLQTHSNVVTITSGGPCRKFPFKPFGFELAINRKPRPQGGKCPKKQKKPLVVDCPRKTNKDCLAELFNEMVMSEVPTDKSKCPKVPPEPTHKRENIPPPVDPCNRKKKPGSLICPSDLLKRGKDNPFKKKANQGEDFAQAITMLNTIQKTRSEPTFFKTYRFK